MEIIKGGGHVMHELHDEMNTLMANACAA